MFHSGISAPFADRLIKCIIAGGGAEQFKISGSEIRNCRGVQVDFAHRRQYGGGLLRYHLKDVVCCTGRFHQTPIVALERRLDWTSDLCGEKVNVRQVDQAFSKLDVRARFMMVAPVDGVAGKPPHYALYIDTDSPHEQLEVAARIVEQHLQTGAHYAYCRRLGQLGELRAYRVDNGWARYLDTLCRRGQRAGDVKPTNLDTKPIWHEAFGFVGSKHDGSQCQPTPKACAETADS